MVAFYASLLYCWGLDFDDFDQKGVFFMNSLILTVFHEFLLLFIIRRNFVRERHKFVACAALQLKFVRSLQNYGE